MTPAEQVKVQINFILNDFVFPQHEIKHNSSFRPCSILGDPNQKNPKWQTIINPCLLSILSPEQQSVNHSQRNSQITHSTHTAGDTAQKQPPVDPAAPANWLQMHHMRLRGALETLPKFTLNLKQNTSSQSFDFSSSRTFLKAEISYLTSASRRLNRWGPK